MIREALSIGVLYFTHADRLKDNQDTWNVIVKIHLLQLRLQYHSTWEAIDRAHNLAKAYYMWRMKK